MAEHLPEPWSVVVVNAPVFGQRLLAYRIEGDVRPDGTEITKQHGANSKRISDCVNACQGIDNPALALKKTRELLRSMRRTLHPQWRAEIDQVFNLLGMHDPVSTK